MSFANLCLMAPEIIAAAAVLLMVILDLLTDNKKAVALLGIIMLLGALLANFVSIGFSIGSPIGSPIASEEIFWMYAIDAYSFFFKILILLAGIITLILALNYNRMRNKNEGEFYFLLSSLVFALMCLVSATDLILIYVLIEFISISSYVLVGMLKTEKSSEGALKYFLLGAVSSGIMLFGMSYVYGLSGTTNLITIGGMLAAGTLQMQPLFTLGAVFILAGFCFKGGLAPFHFWAPDAYEGAPAPVTAILSVGPKCAAFAIFGRIFYTVFPDFALLHPYLISLIGILTMTIGNTAAIWQTDIKRLFAYSSIAQAGYIFIGIAAGSKFGFPGMLFYLMAYIFMNLGVFSVIVLMVNKTGSSKISTYAGLARTNPFLALSFLVFVLALVGIPPTSGFLGKYFLFLGALQTKFYALALFGVLNSVISIFYYFEIVKLMYFDLASSNEKVEVEKSIEAEKKIESETLIEVENFIETTNPTEVGSYNPFWMLEVSVGVCLAFTLISGIFPETFLRFISERGIHFLK
ncbi:MAG: NADH-quinone oxidoreductase subunit N [Candidatus Riflebacteria bacterium]|nr:NADH-quinone oxidoreductase subunit N [Candidatus Riflebacteria bacterium]